MTQPTAITVRHTPGGRLSNGGLSGQGGRTVYVVAARHWCDGGVGAHSDNGCGWDRVHVGHWCDVCGHEFATPRAAIRAADAIDRHGRYVSPKRTER
jgi:hypothetical protein